MCVDLDWRSQETKNKNDQKMTLLWKSINIILQLHSTCSLEKFNLGPLNVGYGCVAWAAVEPVFIHSGAHSLRRNAMLNLDPGEGVWFYLKM